MSTAAATTVFGAGDLQSFVSQLNVWTPQTELTLQELRGAQLVISGQMQRVIESAEMELMKVTASFWVELDTRAAEKAQSDERLKQDIQRLMMQVRQKFVEVDETVATISSTQTASSQTASQPAPQVVPQFVPQTAPSATAQPGQHPWAAGATQSRTSDTIPQGGVSNPQSEAPRDPSQETEVSRRYSVDTKRWTEHENLGLDRKPEEFVAWCDRALGYLAAERRDTRKLLLWAESQKPTNGATGEKMVAISAGVDGDICHISYVIFESLKIIMSDSLLSVREHVRTVPQVIAAKTRKFQDPQRCLSVQHLWEALPSWE